MLAGAVVLGGFRVPGRARVDERSPAADRPQRREVVRRRPAAVRDDQPPQRHGPRRRDPRSRRRPTRLTATLEVVNRNGVGATVVSSQPVPLVAGSNQIPWTPGPSLKPGSYILRLRDLATTPAPVLGSAVVRVMDVEATFRRRSALPGETVKLRVQTDAPWLRLTLLQCGPEDGPTNSNYEMRGVPVGDAAADRPRRPSRPS